jgi:meso-butanediol dehydrogenase/(S,S)-butanediol dehydrogenase/diacetyl reductase
MTGRLQDKVVIVTGGSGGIGSATGRLFCEQGARVVLVDRDADALARVAEEIRRDVPGASLIAVTGDVAQPRDAQRAVQQTLEAFGVMHVLVNNAGVRNYTALADATPDEWQNILEVNLLGAANFCRAALPELRKPGNGCIVNVSSVYGAMGRKGMGLYDATKAGLISMTRTLAHEEVAHGIRANAVCPGSTLTPFHVARAKARGKSEQDVLNEHKPNALITRWARPVEVAYPILWLASDEASYITGTALMVDGGTSVM